GQKLVTTNLAKERAQGTGGHIEAPRNINDLNLGEMIGFPARLTKASKFLFPSHLTSSKHFNISFGIDNVLSSLSAQIL
ncbi:MAG: hypothetical protein ACPF98_07950, partial [Prochlorococcaceae cyanobacterium]